MAAKGVTVAAARADLVARLNAVCAENIGPFPRAAIGIDGAVEGWLANGPALAAEDNLRQALASARIEDSRTGGAAAGPHKSDLRVRHAEKNIAADVCSTGEQKALLIAIVLADLRLLAGERGAMPLLLLDEVVAHLDRHRREALYEEICALGAQAWMTGTDAVLFAPLADQAQHFSVDNATIRPLN